MLTGEELCTEIKENVIETELNPQILHTRTG